MRGNRRGATLIELIVALLLFDLTLLALLGASALTARRIADANRRQRALAASFNRAESFIASPCAFTTSGHMTVERGVVESWSSTLFAGGRTISDSVLVANRSLGITATQGC